MRLHSLFVCLCMHSFVNEDGQEKHDSRVTSNESNLQFTARCFRILKHCPEKSLWENFPLLFCKLIFRNGFSFTSSTKKSESSMDIFYFASPTQQDIFIVSNFLSIVLIGWKCFAKKKKAQKNVIVFDKRKMFLYDFISVFLYAL